MNAAHLFWMYICMCQLSIQLKCANLKNRLKYINVVSLRVVVGWLLMMNLHLLCGPDFLSWACLQSLKQHLWAITGNILRTLANVLSFKVMNKSSPSNMNRMFFQMYLVFNRVLKMLAQNFYVQCTLMIMECFLWNF